MKRIIAIFILVCSLVIYFLYENYQNKDKIIKPSKKEYINSLVISEKNAKVIKLSNSKNFLPFHPVKMIPLENEIIFINQGKLFNFQIKSSKIVEIKIPFYTHEIVNANLFKNKIYFLDKLNLIYVYDLKNKNFIKLNFNQYKDLEPQFISISSSENINILDNSRNKIFILNNNQLKEYKQNNSESSNFNTDNNLTESIDFYSEKGIFYVLEKGNTLKLLSKNQSDEYSLIQKNDSYGYLKINSNNLLKNLYFSGGYNGNIISVSKITKKIEGIYYLYFKNNLLPIFDLCIKNNIMYILAGNYIFIFDDFKENQFKKSVLSKNYKNLFSDSLKNLKGFKIPIDNGDSLPRHSSLFAGARRLYRNGIHEGIDFFENVDTSTPVIATKKGIVIRADVNYKEISISEHKNILANCQKLGFTTPQIANKLRGRQVIIQHENNIISVYSHLSKVNVKKGDIVDDSDIVGYVGNSGTTDGVYKTNKGLHLHFEIHIDDKSKDLEYYLGKYLSVEETMQIYRQIFD